MPTHRATPAEKQPGGKAAGADGVAADAPWNMLCACFSLIKARAAVANAASAIPKRSHAQSQTDGPIANAGLAFTRLPLADGTVVPPRPAAASGTFLRVVTINDSYKLDNYPHVAGLVEELRSHASAMDCVVIATLNGDFLSPAIFTALDGGKVMMEALNYAHVDYACLGNHEFDMGFDALERRLPLFNGVIVNSNVRGLAALEELPSYAALAVGHKTVVLGGFCTGDSKIYNASQRPTVEAVGGAMVATWGRAVTALGRAPDLFLPMTHQLVAEDVASGEALRGADLDLAARTPIILGGHEHEEYLEAAGDATVVKMGIDAATVGIVDIWWDTMDGLGWVAYAAPAHVLPAWEESVAWVRKKKAFVEGTMGSSIARVGAAGSTAEVRAGPSPVVSWLLSLAKKGLVYYEPEIVIVNAGSVRGRARYEEGQPFTLGDLYAEFAFETEMAVVRMPGSLLAESFAFAATRPKPYPGRLHCDSGVDVDAATGEVRSVDGVPFDVRREYNVAIFHGLLRGMDKVEPLVDYYAKHPSDVPSEEACPPIKTVIVAHCMKLAWLRLLKLQSNSSRGLEAAEGGKPLTPAELDERLSAAFDDLDRSQDGRVSLAELRAYAERSAAEDAGGNRLAEASALLARMITSIDLDGDGAVSEAELKNIMQVY